MRIWPDIDLQLEPLFDPKVHLFENSLLKNNMAVLMGGGEREGKTHREEKVICHIHNVIKKVILVTL